jgi:hypothetical protein
VHGEVQGADGAPGGDGLVHQGAGLGVVELELPQQRLPEGGCGVLEDVEQLVQGAVGSDEAQEALRPMLGLYGLKGCWSVPGQREKASVNCR